jgi:hypothetical protein
MDVLLIVAPLFLLNLCASVFCITRWYSDKTQKIAQLIIVWLVPVVGAIGLVVFHRLVGGSNGRYQEFGGGLQQSDDIWRAHSQIQITDSSTGDN